MTALFRILALAALWFAAFAHADQSEGVDTGHGVASLISSHDMVEPGQMIALGVEIDLDPKWHTYWLNPGDSGEPVAIDWNGADVSDLYWPIPMPIATGPIINYGFEGSPLFAVEAVVPPDTMGSFDVTADLYYLVCYDVCIPESATLSLSLPVGESIADPGPGRRVLDAIAASPQPSGVEAGARVENGQLLVDIPETYSADAVFYPYPGDVLEHSAEQQVVSAEAGTRFVLIPGFGWDSSTPEPFDALISVPNSGKGQVVRVVPGADIDIGAVAAPVPTPAGEVRDGQVASLGTAILLAFLGGIILNVMPCVFPVISIKALSLTRAAHAEQATARREAWAYTAGVVATFLAFAAVILALKAGGSLVGWGFQLQNPKVVGVLALLTFVIGLNFLGALEVGGRLQNAGQSLTQTGGIRGAFFTGLLAVIVATPCTGPFMAGALGYTLLAPNLHTLAVFAALALGFALPFLLLAYSPALLARLPKPGPWMETFRQLLAFPLFATSIWLVWVLSAQAGAEGVALVLVAALVVAFGAWLLRRLPARTGALAALLVVAGLVLPAFVRFAPPAAQTAEIASLDYSPWSPEAVQAELAAGRAVFVDFTADWCVTCKANERVALARDDVQQLFAETDTAFLVADWTNKNDAIARELAAYGRAGVPLYLLYPAGSHDGVSPAILPQILTPGLVKDALLEANSL